MAFRPGSSRSQSNNPPDEKAACPKRGGSLFNLLNHHTVMSFSKFGMLRGSKPISYIHLGQEVEFYPVSGRCMYMLQKIAPRLSKLFANLFPDTRNDSASSETTTMDEKGVSILQKVVEIQAASIDTVRERVAQKETAIKQIAEFLFSPEGEEIAQAWIVSSLRLSDDDLKATLEEAKAKTLADAFTIEEYVSLLKGVFAANKKVLGPFSGFLEAVQEKAKAKAKEMMSEKGSGDSSRPSIATSPEPEATT